MQVEQPNTNEYYVKWHSKVIGDIQSITKLSREKACELFKLLIIDEDALGIESALKQVGLDVSNARLVSEFSNYWEYADTDHGD